MKQSRNVFLILVFILFSWNLNAAVKDESYYGTGLMLGVVAVYPIGLATTALYSVSEPTQGPFPYDLGYGFGMIVEYIINSSIRLFLDGTVNSYWKQVGSAGANSESDWVFEQTGYDDRYISFTEDAYFYMDTTGFRIGAKYSIPLSGIRLWAGAGVGYYYWKASYMTQDKSATWGADEGYVWGLTYLAGIDIKLPSLGDDANFITVFADLASPVAYPVIYDLFNDGWLWENAGGNHIMGPYRFGAAFTLEM